MSVKAINEKTALWVSFTLRDKDDALEVPGALEYRIDCLTTGAVIKTDTPVTPASSGEIELTPTETALQSQDNATELRLVTVTADKGTDTQHIETYQYEVKNLRAIT